MTTTLTLVAPAGALTPDHLAATREALRALGASVSAADWLAESEACDLALEGIEADAADAAARGALGAAPVDVLALPASSGPRRKSLLLADMDSTVLQEETLDELAASLGLRERVAAITARAMNGDLDFAAAVRARVALLAGLPEAALAETWARTHVTPGAASLVATMRAHGARCVLVSGGFDAFTARCRDRLGFHADRSNRLEIVDGRLTGRVVEPIRDKDDKLAALQGEAASLGLPLAATLAVGDGANDLPMLRAAGLGVAFRARPSVRAAVRVRVDHGDLTALLFAQGWRRAEFVAG